MQFTIRDNEDQSFSAIVTTDDGVEVDLSQLAHRDIQVILVGDDPYQELALRLSFPLSTACLTVKPADADRGSPMLDIAAVADDLQRLAERSKGRDS